MKPVFNAYMVPEGSVGSKYVFECKSKSIQTMRLLHSGPNVWICVSYLRSQRYVGVLPIRICRSIGGETGFP